MALLQLSLSLSSKIPAMTPVSSPCLTSTSCETGAKTMVSVSLPPPLIGFRRFRFPVLRRGIRRSLVVGMAPKEEKMTRRSPLDFPIEWDRPKPGRRPDIFPQFSPMKTPLPSPMPADPPEEDDEEEEEKTEEEEEDPVKENPEEPEQL
ncbi:uncharacterized protein LOC142546589 [Primulina tabacum]|uniref:uncharacterized protein LOC142546589 n=1 Tax=Primulina tabacum TaxID=48773 RepID=UPI003F59FD6B